MSHENASLRSARVIVVGNEKGGSGKSTVAMHLSIALMKAGYRVATIDLDTRQKSFTNYIGNRRNWASRVSRELEIPTHICIEQDDETASCAALAETIDDLGQRHNFIVVDTPGRDGSLPRLAHSLADMLVTPLNDSFVDFDILGAVDPETYGVLGISHYARMIEELRQNRRFADNRPIDWVVLRNRLSMLTTRNKRLVGEALTQLADKLEFRLVDGLAERMIFREFFPRGLTALDDLDEATLGTRPTMSHATARREVANLVEAMGIGERRPATQSAPAAEISSDARNAA
jgi:chromosome partitioning protein